MVKGDAGELREMVFALIDNALVHGAGAVVLGLNREGSAVLLTISDDGAGVSQDQREAVFERFHKADGASAGAGLGLAIVRQIARNHGGEACFMEAAMVEVRLPNC